jgi:hypothetical protein
MGRITTSNTRIRKSRNGRTEGVVIIHTSYMHPARGNAKSHAEDKTSRNKPKEAKTRATGTR